ncbi:aspartate kinase [Algoriphagus lutimaris]|uniref:aspartate kinase n=1 Tax=Algoriphagus lutimaris TaxID=613197 RepID=UPI00196AF5AE|nr:aspartate kinase [Algoriphagus lutimaris]MBN3520565.1 aspartate kinase [Algoriphagus lutimaris]
MAKMVVYKFGGASVKDAEAIKNLAEILRNRLRRNMVIVVSAMGKTTNALESILELKLSGNDYSLNSTKLKGFHFQICSQLFPDKHRVFLLLENLFIALEKRLEFDLNKENYDEYYDSVIGFGELLSSRIVMEYLCQEGMITLWKDAREFIKTNSDYRFAKINWPLTKALCQSQLKPLLETYPIVTQGFIGSNEQGLPTTLGREGSDFSAAILATSLNAQSITIWKDVPGVLNADPKRYSDTVLFQEIGYEEAAEMTYYGASVIHPKTIKPLAIAGIPLFVKSFLKPDSDGTKIHRTEHMVQVPTYIVKEKQLLVSFKVTDFTFIEEKHIHQVYEQLRALKLRVNMLQISAISISLVMDSQLFMLERLLANLKPFFEIRYNEGLELLTILHPGQISIKEHLEGYEVLLEQSTRNTIQVVRRKKVEN